MECKVNDCVDDVYANDLCNKHYQQIRKYGRIRERTRCTPNDFIIEGDTYKIGCYDNKDNLKGYAFIDVDDYDICKSTKWNFKIKGRKVFYVSSNDLGYLHHLVMGINECNGIKIDHIDGNPLNNRKCNLRIATNADNLHNTGAQRNSTTGYKCIYLSKKINKKNKWSVKIEKDGKEYRSGDLTTLNQAISEYNVMARKLHGEFAVLYKPKLLKRISKD